MTVTINGTTGLATDSTSAVVEAVSLNHPSSATAAITMDASNNVTFDTDTLVVDAANNRVGIGTSSPATSYGKVLHIHNDTTTGSNLRLTNSTSGSATGNGFEIVQIGADDYIINREAGSMIFYTNNTEAMRLDASQNLLVGKTSANSDNAGFEANSTGFTAATRSNGTVFVMDRLASDGEIVSFRKANASVGSIASGSGRLAIGDRSASIRFVDASQKRISPYNITSLSDYDALIDLGESGSRFQDIFATNGTIQTSDANEKQQIALLTDDEITAAKAISKLFKTFKWNSAVEAKGDAARTHTGVIAQEVQQVMTDAGLDSSNYAFFIRGVWWETQTEVPAVEADEENGIEAKEAYTRTETYDTAEEAPDNAVERTRLGIRYPELLSFIGAATEQRLTSIEARLDALETP